MEKNSNLKTGIGRFLTVLCDLMLLNVLWIVCSFPIITIGPATCALFSVMLKIAGEEPISTLSEFFSAFKNNFKKGVILGLLMLFGAVLVYCDIVYGLSLEGKGRSLFLIIAGIAAAIWLIVCSFVFPLQARFENSIKSHILNSFALALCAPGKTLLMWLVYAVPVLLVVILPFEPIAYIGWAYLLFTVSAPVYFTSKILLKIFSKISSASGEKTDES